MPKKPHVRTLMDSQHVKGFQRLLKSSRQYFCHIFRSLQKKISAKDSFLVVSEILRLFVTILTPDDKYSPSVKASFSRNQFKCNYLKVKKTFSELFPAFPQSTKNLEQFETKDEGQRLFVSEIIDWKNRSYLNAEKAPCQNTYGQSTC